MQRLKLYYAVVFGEVKFPPLKWASPVYFPPQKVMGNPDAPPAKSLIIKSTFCGSLPSFGRVQSTLFRIM